ncbi:MAG TPA: Ig-like domain-containing protein [Polyangiaceae bacterium]|nr:Ig-like domain-containing protein [Polyangiaceae bacterium]
MEMANLRSYRSPTLTAALTALPTLFCVGLAHAGTGPGIGNIDCGSQEHFKPFAFIDHNVGGDPHGQNVTVMIRGYFMTVFAPDSGLPPGRIGIYDVSDPRHPTQAKYYSGANTDVFREQHSLPIALIDGKQYIAMQTRAGIQFWDFTDPLNAFVAGRLDLPGVTGGDYENVAWQASWQGHYLFVSGGNQGIYVIDAADPINPQLKNQVRTSATGGFRVGPIFALGDLMVISNMDQGGSYAVLDISEPEDPALLDQKGNAPRMYSIAVGPNQRFYTAGRDGNFLIHSFSDPTNIVEVKNALIGQDQLYAAVQDHFVYLGRQENVVKVDVTNEQNPQVVGEGTLGRDHPDHGQVTPMGNLIYIGNDHGSGSAFFCNQMGQDTTPLSPDTVYPEDGATSVPTQARLSIVFSDFVDLETVSKETIAIRPVDGEALDGVYTYQFNHLSFSPDEPFLADTTYEISIPSEGVADVMGNGLSEDVVVHFSTGSNVTIPDPDPPGSGGASSASGGGGGPAVSSGGSGGGFVAPDGSGGGFVAPSGGASSLGTGGSTAAGGATSSGGTPGVQGDPGPGTGDASGGCSMSPKHSPTTQLLSLGVLGAVLALARRKRRWL